MSITIKDVAKAANVSVATVSRVLNKKSNVSDDAIEAVNKAVEELGYSPNFLGRDLRKSETKRILAIISSMKHGFYSDVLVGMEQAAYAHGYDVLTATTHNEAEHEMHLLGMLFSRSVDAAVLLGTELESEDISKLAENYNIAICLERIENCRVLTVTIDNVKSAQDAVNYLISKGRHKIGMITTEVRSQSSVDREKGYKQALSDNNIPFKEEYIYYGDYDYESGIRGFNCLMELPEPPDAVFAISDTVCIGAMNTAVKRGLEVGKDMLFFGFDNIAYSHIFRPHLSTVEQPCVMQGRMVVEKLIENMKAEEKDLNLYMLPHSLILRESTGD